MPHTNVFAELTHCFDVLKLGKFFLTGCLPKNQQSASNEKSQTNLNVGILAIAHRVKVVDNPCSLVDLQEAEVVLMLQEWEEAHKRSLLGLVGMPFTNLLRRPLEWARHGVLTLSLLVNWHGESDPYKTLFIGQMKTSQNDLIIQPPAAFKPPKRVGAESETRVLDE